MIQEFVRAFDRNRAALLARFGKEHPESYGDIVRAVIEAIHGEGESYGKPDPKRIHEIDDGDYQGTLLYVIAEKTYQPYNYWAVRVSYGSCSVCDTLQGIRDLSARYNDPPTEEQAKQYLTLALHVVQGLREIAGDAGGEA